MQVRYECQLLEPIGSQNTHQPLVPIDAYTLTQIGLSPIELVAFTANANLLAVYANQNKHIIILDTKLKTQRDRFPLKPCDKRFSRQSFCVKGLRFSPDGQRLAVGQSDCIIYVYKLPIAFWNSTTNSDNQTTSNSNPSAQTKPTITGKFVCSSPITCLLWDEPGIIFGTQDGKIKLITFPATSTRQATQNNHPESENGRPVKDSSQQPKVSSLYASPRGAMPLSLTYRNPYVIVGFIDCSIIVLILPNEFQVINNNSELTNPIDVNFDSLSARRQSTFNQQQAASHIIIDHSCPPQKISILAPIANHGFYFCCSGNDGKLSIYECQLSNELQNTSGNSGRRLRVNLSQRLELNGEEINELSYSQTNELIALATNRRLAFVKFNSEVQSNASWRLETSSIEISYASSLCSLQCVQWTRDGTNLIVGTLFGSLELFHCNWSKESIGDQLDICHIAKNRVRISDRSRNLLATYKTESDIKRVNVLDGGRSVIIWTSGRSLLLARLGLPNLQSELKLSALSTSDLKTSSNSTSSSSSSNRFPALKFYFDFSGLVLIFNEPNREVLIIRLGSDSILYNVKFPASSVVHFSRRTIGIRQYPPLATINTTISGKDLSYNSKRDSTKAPWTTVRNESIESGVLISNHSNSIEQHTRVAYVSPTNRTKIQLIDLAADQSEQMKSNTIDHDREIQYIEFSLTSKNLLFLDRDESLNLLTLDTNSHADCRQIIKLSDKNCKFASWLPQSEILIAQNAHLIVIYYEINRLKSTNKQTQKDDKQSTMENNRIIDLDFAAINRKRNNLKRLPSGLSTSLAMEIYDTRSFNLINQAPLIDLSLSDSSIGIAKSDSYPTIVNVSSDLTVTLSNGKTINLDPVRVKFYTHLVSSRDMALQVLEQADQLTSSKLNAGGLHEPLWIKLLWLSVDLDECEIVLKAMHRLGYKQSWINFFGGNLSSTTRQSSNQDEKPDAEDETPVESIEPTSSMNPRIKLALFKGDWNKFEQLAEPEIIQSTYRRTNKWTKLMEYLSRMQQFRQRDLAERDYRTWLISRERYFDAAKLMARNSGDISGALDLLVNAGRYVEAAQLLLSEKQQQQGQSDELDKSSESLEKIHLELLRLEKFNLAARVCHHVLDKRNEALELYIRASNFQPAIELAQELAPDRVASLREAYSAKLLSGYKSKIISKSDALKAIDQLKMVNRIFEAIEAAIDLGDLDRACDIMISTEKIDKFIDSKEKLEQLSLKMSTLLEREGKLEQAVKCLQVAGQFERIREFWLKHKRYDLAFEATLEFLNVGDRVKTLEEFDDYANKMEADGQIEDAENIHLNILRRPQAAIKMHRKLENHDRLLELIAEYEPDQLESQLLVIARELESAGKLEQAERYLMRVSESEWTNVVRMYRLAGNWEQAYRAAREHCSSPRDPLLIQLAFWWSRSMEDAGKARQVLEQLSLLKEVLKFCCENRNYQFALDIVDNYLQSSGEGEENRAEMLKFKRNIVRGQAAQLEQQNKFLEAEQVLLKSDFLEDAIQMYIENERYLDAIRLVETELKSSQRPTSTQPNLDAGVGGNNKTSATTSENESLTKRRDLQKLLNETLIECAKRLEDEVPIKVESSTNEETMGNLSSQKMRLSASDRSKLSQACELYLRAQKPELAVAMYQERAMWQEAIKLAQRYAPALLEQVESALDLIVNHDLKPIVAAANNEKKLNNSDSSNILNLDRNEDDDAARSSKNSPGGEIADDQNTDDISKYKTNLRRYLDNLISKLNYELQRDQLSALISLATFVDNLLNSESDIFGFKQEYVISQLDALEQVLNSENVVQLLSSNSRNLDDSILFISLQKLGYRMIYWCQWGLVDNQEHLAWFRWLTVLRIVCERSLYVRSTDKQSLDDMFKLTKLVSQHCQLIEQFKSAWDEINPNNNVDDALGKKNARAGRRTPSMAAANRRLNQSKSINASQSFKLTPTNASNLSRNPNLTPLIRSIAQQSVDILRFIKAKPMKFDTATIFKRDELLVYVCYITGLWLVASGNIDSARKAWSDLISLMENEISNQAGGGGGAGSSSRDNKLLIRFNVNENRIQEIRAWLLESLLNMDQSNQSENSGDKKISID